MTWTLQIRSSQGWTEADVNKLQKLIDSFKTNARDVLGEYHTSNMGTRKWLLLDHLACDIRRTGGLRHIDAGPYENSHVNFKQAYRQSSQRKATGLEETFSKFNAEECFARAGRLLYERVNKNSSDETTVTATHSPDNGFKFNFLDYIDAYTLSLKLLRSGTAQANVGDLASLQGLIPKEMVHFLSQVGFQGGNVLTALLEEELRRMTSKKYESNSSWRKRVSITSLKSLFLEEGGFLPTISDFDNSLRSIIYNDSYLPISQRAIADYCFGSDKRQTYSYLLIKTLHKRVWVGKAVAFLRIKCNFARKGNPGKVSV